MRPTLPIALLLSACATTTPGKAPAPPAAAPTARVVSSEPALSWSKIGAVEATTARTAAGTLHVVRADLREAELELLMPPDSDASSVDELARSSGYAALTNAAMFATDYATSIGYMRSFAKVNNPRWNPKLRGVLLFHPRRAADAPVKIGTREEAEAYQSAFQTHRVWDPKDGILWKKGASVYINVSLVGVDAQNRVLFFHHPALFDVHELAARILELGLDLRGLLYLDGGHHGVLYLARELGRGNNTGMPLPNVLGLKPAR